MADNPIDINAAVQSMKQHTGWKFLMERYAKKGDDILSKILDVDTPNKNEYGQRDMYVYQLKALGVLSEVLNEIEVEAENALQNSKQPVHKGN